MCAIECIIWFLKSHIVSWKSLSTVKLVFWIHYFEYIIKYIFKILRCQVNCTYQLITQYFYLSPVLNCIITQVIQPSMVHEIK